ncbi:MAG: hypothetical protein AAGG48_22800 [Planctomycetota bacterium]
MDRRTFLRLSISSSTAFGLGGCQARIKRFDPQPERGILEDRWRGHYFDTVTARYGLRLHNPSRSLNRPSRTEIPLLSHDGTEVLPNVGVPTVRPTHAMIHLHYDASSQKESKIAVDVFWPNDGPESIHELQEHSETMTGVLGFDDIRRFLDGAGRFQCDDDNHYYRQTHDQRASDDGTYNVTVHCEISGATDASRFRADIRYADGAVLYRLAELAVPGIG